MKRKSCMLKKRILAGVMASMMMFTSGVPMIEQVGIEMETVYAESVLIDDVEWNYNELMDGTLEITGGNFTDKTEITTPAEIDGKKVTSIAWLAFNYSEISSVIISEGVTCIGMSAFSGCSKLTSISIPESVTRIEDGAFEGCSGLTSIMIPDGVKVIVLNRTLYQVISSEYFGRNCLL